MDTFIWIIIIIVSVLILAVSLITSVSALHKRFIENPLKKKKSIDI